MNGKGFITVYRDIFDWEWFDDAYVFKLFICLIMMAQHEDKNYKGNKIKRGSLISSIESLSDKTKMSKNAVRNSLQKLKSTGEISEIVKPNKYRVITINNYCKYQSVIPQKDNKKDNSRYNKRNNRKDNKKDNSRDTYNNENKYDSLTENHTQKQPPKPRALGERTSAVELQDVRKYQIENRIGGGEIASEFYSAFKNSRTVFPKGWEKIYRGFVNADESKQDEFLRRMAEGYYREQWGEAE